MKEEIVMKTINCKELPLKAFGIPFFEEKQILKRLPDELFRLLVINRCGKRCADARVGFHTDAEIFTVRIALKTLRPDSGISLFSAQSAAVMIGERSDPIFAGLVSPRNYETKVIEKTFRKKPIMEEITVWMPRNEEIESAEVDFPNEARVEKSTLYKHGPVLFYGSSVTEGRCC